MRTAIAAATIFMLVSGNMALASYTVKTTSDVNLRSGKGTESQAIAVVRSGKQLNVIEDGEIWVKVSDSDGKQGWINKKFLTKTKGTPEVKKEEKEENQQAETVTPPPQKESVPAPADASKAVEALNPEQEIQSLRLQLDEVTMQLEALKKETSDCQTIKPEHEKALAEIDNLNKTIDEMDKKIVAKGVRWFLAGAAVLLLGWFLGINTRHKSRYY
ncbi:TIGR04211 family SH3 domain-containing protein [Desulforegula conservatrix]|uniref:TIGR04211 family SH3 domain-containing protein n=1 Tax=Desulforegula conservatrix TaxID=153026 RepID=UPI000428AD2D|nr:TIGR04211 family SH3 domain-containing protein [Desulforegula conservatrix]